MAEKKVTVSVSIPASLHEELTDLCEELGLPLETAVTVFLKQMARDEGLPFKISSIPSWEREVGTYSHHPTPQELVEDYRDAFENEFGEEGRDFLDYIEGLSDEEFEEFMDGFDDNPAVESLKHAHQPHAKHRQPVEGKYSADDFEIVEKEKKPAPAQRAPGGKAAPKKRR